MSKGARIRAARAPDHFKKKRNRKASIHPGPIPKRLQNRSKYLSDGSEE